MNQPRKATERDDFVHFLRQVHRTEFRKVMEKVVMTEAQKGTPKFTGKSFSERANRLPEMNFRWTVVRRTFV